MSGTHDGGGLCREKRMSEKDANEAADSAGGMPTFTTPTFSAVITWSKPPAVCIVVPPRDSPVAG